MLVMLHQMCSETISENLDNSVVQSITRKTSSLSEVMKRASKKSLDIFSSKTTSSEEKITHDFVNPAMRKELEMTSVNISTTANAEQPSL